MSRVRITEPSGSARHAHHAMHHSQQQRQDEFELRAVSVGLWTTTRQRSKLLLYLPQLKMFVVLIAAGHTRNTSQDASALSRAWHVGQQYVDKRNPLALPAEAPPGTASTTRAAIALELRWADIQGMDYLFPLHSDGRLALEARVLTKRVFPSVHAARQHYATLQQSALRTPRFSPAPPQPSTSNTFTSSPHPVTAAAGICLPTPADEAALGSKLSSKTAAGGVASVPTSPSKAALSMAKAGSALAAVWGAHWPKRRRPPGSPDSRTRTAGTFDDATRCAVPLSDSSHDPPACDPGFGTSADVGSSLLGSGMALAARAGNDGSCISSVHAREALGTSSSACLTSPVAGTADIVAAAAAAATPTGPATPEGATSPAVPSRPGSPYPASTPHQATMPCNEQMGSQHMRAHAGQTTAQRLTARKGHDAIAAGTVSVPTVQQGNSVQQLHVTSTNDVNGSVQASHVEDQPSLQARSPKHDANRASASPPLLMSSDARRDVDTACLHPASGDLFGTGDGIQASPRAQAAVVYQQPRRRRQTEQPVLLPPPPPQQQQQQQTPLEPPSAAMESGQQPPAVKPAPTLECPPASWPAIHPPHHAEGVELRCWTMVLYFTDKEVPPMLSRFVKSDVRLLKLYESGLPAWSIILPSYGLWYRPWMRRVTWALFTALSVLSMVFGFYDLYKNVPIVRQAISALSDTLFPSTSLFFEWLEKHAQIRLSILLTYVFSKSPLFMSLMRFARGVAGTVSQVLAPLALQLRALGAPLLTLLAWVQALLWTLLSPFVSAATAIAACIGQVGSGVVAVVAVVLGPPARLLWSAACGFGAALASLASLGRALLWAPGMLVYQLVGLLQLAGASALSQLQVFNQALAGAGQALAAAWQAGRTALPAMRATGSAVRAAAGAAAAAAPAAPTPPLALVVRAGREAWALLNVSRTTAYRCAKALQAVMNGLVTLALTAIRHRVSLLIQLRTHLHSRKQYLPPAVQNLLIQPAPSSTFPTGSISLLDEMADGSGENPARSLSIASHGPTSQPSPLDSEGFTSGAAHIRGEDTGRAQSPSGAWREVGVPTRSPGNEDAQLGAAAAVGASGGVLPSGLRRRVMQQGATQRDTQQVAALGVLNVAPESGRDEAHVLPAVRVLQGSGHGDAAGVGDTEARGRHWDVQAGSPMVASVGVAVNGMWQLPRTGCGAPASSSTEHNSPFDSVLRPTTSSPGP